MIGGENSMNLITKHYILLFFCSILSAIVLSTGTAKAQLNQWIRFSNVWTYFTDYGTELENDAGTFGAGLVWPAAYGLKHCSVRAKGLWIGCQNFTDPVTKLPYAYKVLTIGPRTQASIDAINTYTQPFKYIGKYNHPLVIVDGKAANTTMGNYDNLDQVDPNMKADRMIVNTINTPMGLTMTRKIMVFPNQYNNNFFVYDYVFKNTGIINREGTVVPQTLDSCMFVFQYRYTLAGEAIASSNFPVVGWAAQSTRWGFNTLSQVVGTDPTSPDFRFRALYGFYGPHSGATNVSDDWGCPNPYEAGSVLAAARYIGCVTLHADKSAQDKSDDLSQPMNTTYIDTDDPLDANPCVPYDVTTMGRWYTFMRYGKSATGLHPKSHADEFIASGQMYAELFSKSFLGSSGGPGQIQGFGPYNLGPGDSIHIVLAEGVAGLDRDTNRMVSNNWYAGFNPSSGVTPTYTLPSGVSISGNSLVSSNPVYTKYKTGTTDYDLYKDAWVFSIEDSSKPYSIQRMFQRAIDLHNSGYDALQPPPAPEQFLVTSGAIGIQLTWTASEAKASAHFNGFVVYRAAGSVFNDVTVYKKIWECDKSYTSDSYLDTAVARATGYFYYIQSKSDGLDNTIEPGVPLLSSQFLTQTEEAAYLLKEGKASLDSIYVVPNPYIVRSRKLQWGMTLDPTLQNQGFDQDRIAFVNLPKEGCTIRIFTERGELIWQKEHTNGSGDEHWNQKTTYGQTIVSGIYIAHFQTNSGKSVFRKFVVVR